MNKDPRGKYVKLGSSAATSPDGKSKLTALHEQLKQDIVKGMESQAQEAVKAAAAATTTAATSQQDKRIEALEVGMQELKGQNAQFGAWFQQASDRMKSNENTMGAMQQTLISHQSELHANRP